MNKVTRLLVVSLMVAGLCMSASAARMEEGTQELGISGSAQDTDVLAYTVEVGYGYFIAKDLVIGGNVGYEADDDAWEMNLGANIEYNFDTESTMVPFVGAGIRWAYADNGAGDNEDSYVLVPNAGVKFFVVDTLSVGAKVAYYKADVERYKYEDEWKDNKVALEVETRFYF